MNGIINAKLGDIHPPINKIVRMNSVPLHISVPEIVCHGTKVRALYVVVMEGVCEVNMQKMAER